MSLSAASENFGFGALANSLAVEEFDPREEFGPYKDLDPYEEFGPYEEFDLGFLFFTGGVMMTFT